MEGGRCVGKTDKGKVGRNVEPDLPNIDNVAPPPPGLRKGIPQVREVDLTGGRKPWDRTALLGNPAPPHGPAGVLAIFGAMAAGEERP